MLLGESSGRRATQTPRDHSRKHLAWTLAEINQLGKAPDSVVACRTRRTIEAVVAERQRRRIRLQTPPRRWTASETRLLGRLVDRE